MITKNGLALSKNLRHAFGSEASPELCSRLQKFAAKQQRLNEEVARGCETSEMWRRRDQLGHDASRLRNDFAKVGVQVLVSYVAVMSPVFVDSTKAKQPWSPLPEASACWKIGNVAVYWKR